jgi:hypothetical protein
MHLDEEQIQRVLHRELAGAEFAAAREHLAECSECRTRLAEATREQEAVLRLLGGVDHPAPRVAVEDIVSRSRRHATGRVRWAAGLILALGAAGAAYAVPGSPVRAWVAAVAEWLQGRETSAPKALPPVQPTPSAIAGIAVTPSRHFVIHFTAAQAVGHARVSLTAGSEIVVQGPNGAATYTSGVDRLEINNTGSSADFEIHIPQSAPWVEIWLGADRMLLKDGARISGVTPGGAPPYLLDLSPR